MKEHTDIKQESAEPRGNRYGGGGFKKKKGFKKHNNSTYIDDIFRGVGFKTGKEGLELYTRTIEKLGLNASAHFKNGADVKKCLKAGKVIKPKMPDLAENHTANEKRIWDHRVTEILKAERTLENNLCNLFAIVMSLCDSDMKNQIENMTEYLDVEAELDSIQLLGMIKQLIYTGGTNDLNKSHNREMAHLTS